MFFITGTADKESLEGCHGTEILYIYIYIYIYIFIVLFLIVQASILLCVAAPGRGREYAVLDYCAAQLFRGHLASSNETQTG